MFINSSIYVSTGEGRDAGEGERAVFITKCNTGESYLASCDHTSSYYLLIIYDCKPGKGSNCYLVVNVFTFLTHSD